MKINQQEPEFKPINITLETKEETEEFLNYLKKLEPPYSQIRTDLIVFLSNALTNQTVKI